MKAIYLATLVVVLSGCASGGSSPAKDAHSPPPPGAIQISGSEISSQFIGRSHQSVTSSGQAFTEVLTADGKAKIQITGSPQETGNWKLEDHRRCYLCDVFGLRRRMQYCEGE